MQDSHKVKLISRIYAHFEQNKTKKISTKSNLLEFGNYYLFFTLIYYENREFYYKFALRGCVRLGHFPRKRTCPRPSLTKEKIKSILK